MLEVGQKLWWVSRSDHSHRKDGREVIVTKIGHKWATLENGHRIDLKTMIANGGNYSSPGRCYLSHEDYDRLSRARDAWREFAQCLIRPCPDDMTSERILEARKLLGLD